MLEDYGEDFVFLIVIVGLFYFYATCTLVLESEKRKKSMNPCQVRRTLTAITFGAGKECDLAAERSVPTYTPPPPRCDLRRRRVTFLASLFFWEEGDVCSSPSVRKP